MKRNTPKGYLKVPRRSVKSTIGATKVIESSNNTIFLVTTISTAMIAVAFSRRFYLIGH